MSTPLNIGIAGCSGRVGKLLVKELVKQDSPWKDIQLAAGSVRKDSAHENKDIGEIAGLPSINLNAQSDPKELFAKSDVVIDFTSPALTIEHARLAAQENKALIIGTTGLSSEDEQVLKESAKNCVIVYAANMSVGVNLLLSLVKKTASILGEEDWDIEINETHHKHKVDAPSGTALALGHAAANGRDVALDNVGEYVRHGDTGARNTGKIGFSVQRGGDVVGEHTVTFFGEGERIELTHKATDRSLFAKGAIKAAIWSHKQDNGLYSMQDVLDI